MQPSSTPVWRGPVLAANFVFDPRFVPAPFRRVPVVPLASLRSRLLAVVGAAIAPFVLYAALSGARARSVAISTLRETSLSHARAVARSLDARLSSVDQMLDAATVQVRLPRVDTRVPQSTTSGDTFLDSALSIALLDTSGRRAGLLIGSASRIDSIPLARRRTLVLSALSSTLQSPIRGSTSSTYVDEGIVRTERDSIAMIIVRPVVRGRIRCNCPADASGAVVAVVSDAAVRTLLGSDSLPEGGVAVLTGRSGGLLGRPQAPERWTERDSRDTAVVAAGVAREGVLELDGQDGVRRSVGFAALKRLPWRVYVGVPQSSSTGRLNSQLRDALMLAALALAIAVLGVIVASRSLGGPLQTLVADTKRLAAGALSHRSEVAGDPGELGALGAAMNSLAETLEAKRKAMHEGQRLAAEMFDTSPVASWVADASPDPVTTGRISQANSAAYRLFGGGGDSLTGRRDTELLDASCAHLVVPPPGMIEHPARLIRSGRGTISSADGSSREYDIHVTFVPHARHLVRVVTVMETVPRTATPAAPPRPAPDTTASDNATVSFAGHVAENFSHVMQGLAGFSQLALETAEDPDVQQIALERLRDLASDGLAVAGQLRSYARHDVLQLELTDANALLSEAAQTMADSLGSQIELDMQYNVSPAPVSADVPLLTQVLETLIATARDAMPAGGTLTLTTTLLEVPSESSDPAAVPPGPYIVITIANTGMGLTADARLHLFEPYWSTRQQQHGGTGLGLAAVAGIAQQHGWALGVESEPQVGTAIFLYLPLAADGGPDSAVEGDQSSLETVPARSV